MKSLILLLTLFGAFCSAAPSTDDLQRLLQISLKDEKAQLLFEIPAAKAGGLPKWSPESAAPPPVSLQQAGVLAKAALKQRQPDVEEFEVYEIRLKEISWSKRFGSWFYTVTCVARRDGKIVTGEWTAIILMDGTSVEPTILRK